MSTLFDFDSGKTAIISPCGLYRYRLTRRIGPGDGLVNFIMLNPSTADAEIDDPTIRRCCGFTRDWGYGELVVTNLFALRSTDPRALKTARDPIGPENDLHTMEAAHGASVVVCAWGAHGTLKGRAAKVVRMLADYGIDLGCLRLTKEGYPGHPLYLPRESSVVSFGKGRS